MFFLFYFFPRGLAAASFLRPLLFLRRSLPALVTCFLIKLLTLGSVAGAPANYSVAGKREAVVDSIRRQVCTLLSWFMYRTPKL